MATMGSTNSVKVYRTTYLVVRDTNATIEKIPKQVSLIGLVGLTGLMGSQTNVAWSGLV